ncbi:MULTISPECIES: TRAP transporter large permease [unclassified Marinobacter]|jgi:tripartite ATP-independent transporter DctM subunit|uniref:TRAP transporter large permease n=1 Tax=unclassified Marinobacter TaxID=83889 RepID=UPI00200BB3DD|nr:MULTISPECIES: TRAP transporter large permease [unclassified Marinobacter]MCL1477168.1 TRAP transporter large permease [Marinobacter sp.]MCL1484864.1 TRAP transporter large permease [Marinobacter sp.]UQG56479.1 TRAP transporter large permease [Marinobacter sp. M4C]UQG65283.1 TRAP transporter large permease [Marinobacter sp. M2C]UQG69562.1 TRAP transporter large permease [Marinobacter sp. M1C]
MTLAIIITFLVLALLRMPLAFALGLASLVGLFIGDMDFSVMPQRMMHSIDNFPLMAIPLFMLAGELMVAAGILQRLVDFANSLVGRVHGGLAHVAIVAGMVLAAVSGAAVASASALGSALIPSMREKYGTGYSSAVVASAANLGAIIPPSNAMIVYALMAGSSVSVGGLFMAGVVPGIILAVGFMGLASFISARRRYPLSEGSMGLKHVLIQTWRALPILLMPVVIVGGIVAGAFTATEGAAIAVVYSLIMGFFVTRQLRLSDLPKAMFKAAVTAAMVGALIAFASTITFAFTIDLIPMQLANWLQDFTSDPMTFLLLVMGILILVGMFIESNAAFIMLVPLLAPIALSYGIDPLLFGFLFVMNLVVGMMTPPVGVLLFVMCGISKISLNELMKSAWPFIVFQYLVLAACMLFPDIVTWLPRTLGY